MQGDVEVEVNLPLCWEFLAILQIPQERLADLEWVLSCGWIDERSPPAKLEQCEFRSEEGPLPGP